MIYTYIQMMLMQSVKRSRWSLSDSESDDESSYYINQSNVLDQTKLKLSYDTNTAAAASNNNKQTMNKTDQLNETARLLEIMNTGQSNMNKNNKKSSLLDQSILNHQINHIVSTALHKPNHQLDDMYGNRNISGKSILYDSDDEGMTQYNDTNQYIPNTTNNINDTSDYINQFMRYTTYLHHNSKLQYDSNVKQQLQQYIDSIKHKREIEQLQLNKYMNEIESDYIQQIAALKSSFLQAIQHKSDELNQLMTQSRHKYNRRMQNYVNDMVQQLQHHINETMKHHHHHHDKQCQAAHKDSHHKSFADMKDTLNLSQRNTHHPIDQTLYLHELDHDTGTTYKRRASVIQPIHHNNTQRNIFNDDIENNNDHSLHVSQLDTTKLNQSRYNRIYQSNHTLDDSDDDNNNNTRQLHSKTVRARSRGVLGNPTRVNWSSDDENDGNINHTTTAINSSPIHSNNNINNIPRQSINSSSNTQPISKRDTGTECDINNSSTTDLHNHTRHQAALLSRSFRQRLLTLQHNRNSGTVTPIQFKPQSGTGTHSVQ